jgi:outer membrane protein assembly factor BamB
MGATGVLDCLDGATGHTIWSRDILADAHGRNQTYGKSCSPLLIDDLVVVTGSSAGPSLMAYHAGNGFPDWQGGNESPGYASPVVATLAGMRQILTINSAGAAAHDPGDGHLLWRFDWPGSMPKDVNPIAIDSDRVLISAGYGLGTTLLTVRSNGGTLSVAPRWTSRQLKPKFANNAVRGNYVFGLDDGVLTCLDLSGGKRKWRDGRYGFGEVLLVDDLLVVQTEPGDVALVEATPDEFRELGTFHALGDKAWACPALAGHYLLVRNDREAACFQLP